MKTIFFQFFQVYKNITKKIDPWVVFCTMGFFLPSTILVYRWFTICLKTPFLFKEYSFFFINNLFWEPFFFCYFSSFFFGFFLYKKKPSFRQKLFIKSGPLFCVFFKILKIESSFCERKFIALLLLLSYFYFYLVVSFKGYFLEGFFLSFRQVVISYFLFKTFFESVYFEKDSLYDFRFLTFYDVFIKDYINLQSEENKNNLQIFYALNSLLLICFFRENIIIEQSIKNYQQKCEFLLSLLQDKEKQYDLTLEKNKLFNLKQKKPFFFIWLLTFLPTF